MLVLHAKVSSMHQNVISNGSLSSLAPVLSSLFLILGHRLLCLRRNASLVGMAMSTLLTTVHHVCLLFGHAGRVAGELAADLVGCVLKVGFSVKGGLDCWWNVSSGSRTGGLGSTLIDGGDVLGFGREAALWWLGLACGASLAGLEVVGVLHGSVLS